MNKVLIAMIGALLLSLISVYSVSALTFNMVIVKLLAPNYTGVNGSQYI
jgi:hypothetical protein